MRSCISGHNCVDEDMQHIFSFKQAIEQMQTSKCRHAWKGGGRSQKSPNLCGHPLWMTLNEIFLGILEIINTVVLFQTFAKRLIQVCAKEPPSLLCGVFFLLSEVRQFFILLFDRKQISFLPRINDSRFLSSVLYSKWNLSKIFDVLNQGDLKRLLSKKRDFVSRNKIP